MAALVFLCLATALTGCQRDAAPRKAIIFCAASLTLAVDQCMVDQKSRFAIQSGGSNLLATQYLAGAPADILLLADVDVISRTGHQQELESAIIASNELVLIEGKNRVGLSRKPTESILALADPLTAPLGKYSLEALETERIQATRILLKDATAVLSAVASGHADLGVVYTTDAKNNPSVKIIKTFQPESYSPIFYQALLVEPQNPAARTLFEALQSDRGEKILGAAGFKVISKKSKR